MSRSQGLTPRFEAMDRSAPVWVLTAAALGLLILLPLGWLGYMSVSSEGGVTLDHYARVFTDPRLQRALWNTVVLAFWSGIAATRGAPVVISIRPHQIELAPGDPAAPAATTGANALTGTLLRASYLGDAVDYQVQLEQSDAILRVTGPTPPRAHAGERVVLRIDPAACVPLVDSA